MNMELHRRPSTLRTRFDTKWL